MKIFAYDIESTGTNPGRHGIHQIAFIVLIDGKEKERIDFKVRPNPKAVIEKEALEVAGVTLEQIMAYPPMEEVYAELIKILGKYIDKFNKTDKFFLLGYNNAGFDDNFLRGFFLQNGDKYFGSWFWADPMDVRVFAIRQLASVRYQMPNFKLMTVARQMGVEVDESKLHDATYDIDITLEIFKRLRLSKPELMELNEEYNYRAKVNELIKAIDNYQQTPIAKLQEEGFTELLTQLDVLTKPLRKEVVS